MKKAAVVLSLLVGAGWLIGTGSAAASINMQKQAKDAGVTVTGCVFCHNEKLPKKDAMTLNDRGKWLVAEKTKRNAKEVDGAWAKEYKESEKK